MIEDKNLYNMLKQIPMEVYEANFNENESELEDDISYLTSVDASTVRSSLHIEAISVRDELQTHLRAAMQNGDEMLDKVRGVSKYFPIRSDVVWTGG